MIAWFAALWAKKPEIITKLLIGLVIILVAVTVYGWVSSVVDERDELRTKLATEQLKTALQTRTIESLRSQHSQMLQRYKTLSERNSVDFEKWRLISSQLDAGTLQEDKIHEEADRINLLNSNLNRMLEHTSSFSED